MDYSTTYSTVLTHPRFGARVEISAKTVYLAIADMGGAVDPRGILKRITTGNHLTWIESEKELGHIQDLTEEEAGPYKELWATYLLSGVEAVARITSYDGDLRISEKVNTRLKRAGLDTALFGWTLSEPITGVQPPYDPKLGRLETIEPPKNYGVDNAKTYEVFDTPLPSHSDAKLCYRRRVRDIKTDPDCSFIRSTSGYQQGKLDSVLSALFQHRLYEEADDKSAFRSLVTKHLDPSDLIAECRSLLEGNIKNKTLLAMELDALSDAGPFNRYPVEYWEHKLYQSYAPKNTSFDFTVYNNAWKIVARMVMKAITKHDQDMERRFPGYSHLRFSPDATNDARKRKRDTSNAGFPTFGKYLDTTEWDSFESEVNSILRNPFDHNPLHYPMIVGNRIVGKDLQIPEGLSKSEKFEYIQRKNKQRIIQMGSSVEFILGSKFTHPLFRVLAKYSEPFKGMKSWINVKSDIGRRLLGAELAFGADATNFDASVSIFDWLQVKRLFQLVYPGHSDVLEWYFTLCAYCPTITVSGTSRRAILVEGCSGVGSGVACTAMVDSLVELVRATCIAIEKGYVDNDPLAEYPSDFMAYVCGDDLGYLIGKDSYKAELTAGEFCELYRKYGGDANPSKQLVTTPQDDLGITLLFLKRLFSVNPEVGFGTRLLSHAMVGLIYTNPQDTTSAAKVLSGFLEEAKDANPRAQAAYLQVAISADADRVAEGDLLIDGRLLDRRSKQITEANRRGRKLISAVKNGHRVIDEHEVRKIVSDPTIKWIYNVSDPSVLEEFVNLGIISEEDADEQIQASAETKLYDKAKLHLIKAVQQLEDCHPHPYFRVFVEWVFKKNPAFFSMNLLEGDEAAKIARYVRATSFDRGLWTWKVVPLLQNLWFGRDADDQTTLTRAFVDAIARHGEKIESFLSPLSECHSMRYDQLKRTCELLLTMLITDRGHIHQGGCFNEEQAIGYAIRHITAIKRAGREHDIEKLTELSLQIDDIIKTTRESYASFKKHALVASDTSTAPVETGPNESNT